MPVKTKKNKRIHNSVRSVSRKSNTASQNPRFTWNLVHALIVILAITAVVILITNLKTSTELRSKAAPILASTLMSWDFNTGLELWSLKNANYVIKNGQIIITPGNFKSKNQYSLEFLNQNIILPAGVNRLKIRTDVIRNTADNRQIQGIGNTYKFFISTRYHNEKNPNNAIINVKSGSMNEYTITLPSRPAQKMKDILINFPTIPYGYQIYIDYIRLENIPLQTPSPGIIPDNCHVGVKALETSGECVNEIQDSQSSYRYAIYTCDDGYSGNLGSAAICKTSTVWRTEVEAICAKRSNCRITPSTTITPTFTPTPTPRMTWIPLPTATVTFTPTPGIVPICEQVCRPVKCGTEYCEPMCTTICR